MYCVTVCIFVSCVSSYRSSFNKYQITLTDDFGLPIFSYVCLPFDTRLWEIIQLVYIAWSLSKSISKYYPLLTLIIACPPCTPRIWEVQHYSRRPYPVLHRACGTTRWKGHRCRAERQWFHGWVGPSHLSWAWKTLCGLCFSVLGLSLDIFWHFVR